jgi:hypothetical protein
MITPNELTPRERRFCMKIIIIGCIIVIGVASIDMIFHISNPNDSANIIWVICGVGLGLSFAPLFMSK